MPEQTPPLKTPDGRYSIVRGRLWRASNPSLPAAERQRIVDELMDAPRALKKAKGDKAALTAARRQLDQAKTGLGERGQVWWEDGQADLNRHMGKNPELNCRFDGG